MPARTRNKVETTPFVGQLFNSSWVEPKWHSRGVSRIVDTTTADVTGNSKGANAFHSIKRTRSPVGLLNGKRYLGTPPVVIREYASCPSTYIAQAPDPPMWNPTALEQANHAFAVKEGSNPSKPHVSVPTIIGELKDLPSLVKDWGGSLLTKVAKGHLTWRWAIRPMMSDFRKLLDFQAAAEKRFTDIKRLSEGKWIKKRVSLGSTSSVTSLSQVVIESELGGLVYCSRTQLTTTTTWGSCRWQVSPASTSSLPKSRQAQRNLAYRQTFGITSYETLAATWELLPWSWLVDWFVPVGGMISANNNSLGLLPGTFCIMRTGKETIQYHVTTKPDWVTISSLPSPSETTRKQRLVVTLAAPPLPSLTPLLSADKWSILTSLAAVRAKSR